MLKEIVECKQQTNIVIIEDNLTCRGEEIFGVFLKHHMSSGILENLLLLCFENPPRYYCSQFGVHPKICRDLCSDPLQWNDPGGKSGFEAIQNDNVGSNTIFIDSLSLLILHKGLSNAYKDIFTLSKTAKKIVCLYHGDVVNSEEINRQLRFLSTCYISLLANPQNEKIVEIALKKPGGKVVIQKEMFSVEKNGVVSSQALRPRAKTTASTSGKVDMESLTTFKLGLEMSLAEKIARKELVLPYLRAKRDGEGGKILYDTEPQDDMEEDPDDDLDI